MSNGKENLGASNYHENTVNPRRASSSTAKSAASSVETTVTKLLMSTKQLLQTLTQWSRGSANERAVSDAYVQLGNDFKVVSKFFSHCGVDILDLGDVPMNLRKVLEVALREKPSDDTLNKYLPTIREIIVTLLDKLKVKQALLKTMKQEQLWKKTQHQQRPSLVSSLSLSGSSTPTHSEAPIMVKTPRKSVDSTDGGADVKQETMDDNRSSDHKNYTKQRTLSETEALSQLKKGTNLQRRASKRFSAYHMAKLTNQSTTEAAAAAALASVPPACMSELSSTATKPNEIILEESSKLEMNPSNKATVGTAMISKDSNENYHTVFLTMNGRTKRCSIEIPSNMNALRLLFVDKFAYSPGGNTFPDVYVKDPEYSVFYELDEQALSELRDGCVIELRTNDDKDSKLDLSDMITAVRAEMSRSQEDILGHIRDLTIRSQQTVLTPTVDDNAASSKFSLTSSSMRDMKQELSVLRQLHNESKKSVESTTACILEKLAQFRLISLDSTTSSNRAYMEKSQTRLGGVSDALLSRVDDLQDLIEILRKDVAARGAKPSKKKLDSVQKELIAAEDDLSKMREFIGTEKPHWKKIWEAELDKVCEEQQFLTLQEDLAADLEEDLGKALETFELVNLCCVEQEKNPNRSKSNPILPIPRPGTFNKVREQLLVDVQSLNPDHDGRVEALEKAEKLWQKEREYRDNGEFEDELESFVGNGSFKRSGGVEEVERLRKQKDEKNLRANFGGLGF